MAFLNVSMFSCTPTTIPGNGTAGQEEPPCCGGDSPIPPPPPGGGG